MSTEEPGEDRSPEPDDGRGHEGATEGGGDDLADLTDLDGLDTDEDDADGAAAAAVQARRMRGMDAKLAELGDRIEQLAAQHTDLGATVSEMAPTLAELDQLARTELDELKGLVKQLFDEQEKAQNPPVDWPALTAVEAAAQWPILARWIGEVLVPWYRVTRAELPDCWALHAPVVVELSWLRSAYTQSYLTHTHPHIAGEWHVRWRPTVLARIAELITDTKCRPGEHLIAKEDSPSRNRPPGDDPTPTPPRGTRRGMPTPPRYQLALAEHWWPFYQQAFHADLATRRRHQPRSEADWTPEPPPTSG